MIHSIHHILSFSFFSFLLVISVLCTTYKKNPKDECEQNIHTVIIDENPLYNTAVPPITSYHNNPLVVTVQFDYQALEAVEVGDGTATIFSTLRLTWLDPRLAWSITETTCANTITVFTGHDVETTQIWVPDFDLVNQIEGVQAMPVSTATVYRYVTDGRTHISIIIIPGYGVFL